MPRAVGKQLGSRVLFKNSTYRSGIRLLPDMLKTCRKSSGLAEAEYKWVLTSVPVEGNLAEMRFSICTCRSIYKFWL